MTIRVLIAEDHALVRDGISKILRGEDDIEIVGEASDGIEAVALAAKLNPDVLLMDIAMPRMNGIEATRAIKAANPAVMVIVLSAYEDDAYVFAMLELGAVGYILKNASGTQLVAAIRAVSSGESVLSLSVARRVMPRSTDEQAHPLSARELEVLRLAAAGMANQAIAHELAISLRTVQFYIAQIFEKLGVGSRTEAAVIALKRGLLRLEEIP